MCPEQHRCCRWAGWHTPAISFQAEQLGLTSLLEVAAPSVSGLDLPSACCRNAGECKISGGLGLGAGARFGMGTCTATIGF